MQRLKRLWALTAFLAALLAASGALADDFWTIAGFFTNPTTVTVDVVDIDSGATVIDDGVCTQVTIDGNNSAYWRFDLSTVTGFPTGCDRKNYLLEFSPDGANCDEDVTPALCATTFLRIGADECIGPRSSSYIHTSTVKAAQGISQTVLDFYTQRGTLPLLWIEHRYASDHNFSNQDQREYEVYFYTDGAAAPRVRCTVSTDVSPTGSLPSSSHCTP